MNPLSLVEKLINEHGSSTILRDRLSLLKEMLAKVEQERTELIAKCSSLERANSNLREQLNEKHVPEEFTEYMGGSLQKRLFWKIHPNRALSSV